MAALDGRAAFRQIIPTASAGAAGVGAGSADA